MGEDGKADTEAVDAAWEDEPPPTREAPSTDLRRMARSAEAVPSARGPNAALPVPRAPTPAPVPAVELRATMPPPVPASEYVATMMGRVPESEVRPASPSNEPPSGALRPPPVPGASGGHKPTLAERHRAILQTLHEEDPLRFDFDDLAPAGADEQPLISTRESLLDDVEIVKDTKPPPVQPSARDLFDELDIDEVLVAVSERPPAKPTAPARPMPASKTAATVKAPEPVDLSLEPSSSEPKALTISDIPISARPATAAPAIPKAAPVGVSGGAQAAVTKPAPAGPAGSKPGARAPIFPLPPAKSPTIATKAALAQTEPAPREVIIDEKATPARGSLKLDPPLGGGVHERATIPGYDPNDPIDRVHDRFVVGDYSGALVLAEGVLAEQPGHPEATKYAESCREMLRQMYLSRLGDGAHVPRVVMGADQLRWLTLDHRAGFLLSCIDGSSSVDEILDVSGMASLDALRILHELLQEGVIEIVTPSSGRG